MPEDQTPQRTTTGSTHEEPRPSVEEMDAMGEELAVLAGQIAAATARFISLLGRYDACGGWGGVGIRSAAHWLSWRAGMSLRTARDHVRVARALRHLPLTEEAFGRGELSFSKVRALTRVATSDTEAELVTIACNAPAAQVEKLVAGLRKVKRERGHSPDGNDPADGDQGDADPGEEPGEESGIGSFPTPPPAPPRGPVQRLQWRWDEDTDELVVWGRFGAADGKTILAALTRAELERIRTTAHDLPADAASADAKDSGSPATDPAGQSRSWESGERPEAVDRTAPPPIDAGPALVALAQIGLSVQDSPAYAPAAEVIYLHQAPESGAGCSAEHPSSRLSGVVCVDDGPALDTAGGQEVMCASAARCVLRDGKGAVLAYGDRRRLFSATQLKALHLRDRSCRTPGCQRTRFLHAHHVVFWSDGGRTDLDNAILLCSSCHRAVHLGRLRIRALGGQQFEFVDPMTGRVMVDAPPMFGLADQIVADRTITPWTVAGRWEGERLDLSELTSALIGQWRARASWPAPPGGPPVPWDELRPRTWDDGLAA